MSAEAVAADVTAQAALAMGRKLCANQDHTRVPSVSWTVSSAECETFWTRGRHGPCWMVDGQYHPKNLAPGVIEVDDWIVWVPKDGTPPSQCVGTIN